MSKLTDQINQDEQKANTRKRTSTVKKISTAASANRSAGSKDKQISAKVNSETYEEFSQINRIQGMTNNSVINQLIYKYVRKNRSILDDLED